MTTIDAHDVFISHSAADRSVADAICASMEHSNVHCWIAPRDIRPGDEWTTAVSAAVQNCRLMVMVFSENSNDSTQVRREVQLAFECEKTVVPFRITDVEPASALKFYMTGVHWLDATTPPIMKHIETLVAAAVLALSPENPTARSAPASVRFSSTAVTPQVSGNLPHELVPFIGRVPLLEQISSKLPSTRSVTLTGPGGTGKTRLALKAALDMTAFFGDGAWFVELAAVADPRLIAPKVLTALQVAQLAGTPPEQTLIRALAGKDALLLILDNCEHLLKGCAELAEQIVRETSGVTVLCTSRERLATIGEVVISVPPMIVPGTDQKSRASLSTVEAVQLFADRAHAVQPTFALTELNAPVVSRVCRRLDGIPLAIVLAAARLRGMSLDQLSVRISGSFRLLVGGGSAQPPRQQTLRATVDWSYDLLTGTEKAALRRVAVFAGGWTLAAAETVLTSTPSNGIPAIEDWQVLDLLTSLLDKSLIEFDVLSEPPRYRVLETIRQYSAEKLADNPDEEQETRRKHGNWCLELTGRGQRLRTVSGLPHRIALISKENAEWFDELDDEGDNIRTAFEYFLTDECMSEAALVLAEGMSFFFDARGREVEGLQILTRALIGNSAALASTAALAHALFAAGILSKGEAKRSQSISYLDSCVGLSRSLGLEYLTAHAVLPPFYVPVRELVSVFGCLV